ncbi:MAG: outer membrane protein assembly factor BamA [Myxococcales bacterium]|nr:outer membrane protein assembly factor BamA [Myxococcales bacterium]
MRGRFHASAGRRGPVLARALLLAGASAAFAWPLPATGQESGLFGKGALSGSGDGMSLKDADPADEAARAAAIDGPLDVTAVELGGIERVDETALRKQLKTVAGARLDPTTVADDVRRIWQMGLFDDVRVGLRLVGVESVVVRFQVLERPSIAAVEVRGNDAQSEEEVMKVVDLRANHLYSAADADANVQKIKDMYTDEGHFLATVRHHTEPLGGNQVRVVFDIEERAEVKVRHIELLGNDGVPDTDIKAVLRTKEGTFLSSVSKDGNFKRDQLDYDVQVIQYLYLTRGYIQAKIDEPVVSLSPDLRYISISIRVREGPQYTVGKLAVVGDSVEAPEKLQKDLTLLSGETFNYANVQADGQKLAAAQKNFGYAHATVSNESVPNAEKRTVDWTYHIQKGKKCYFGQIVMAGGGSTRDKVIRRELTVIEGDLYSEAKLQESQARVQRLGYFEKVEIKTRPTALPQVLDLVVEVKERTTGTFQVGMGFSSVDNFITTAQISKDNFLGRGQKMSVQGQLSSVRQMFQGSFWEPYFLDTNVTFSLDLFSYEQLYTDFARRSTGGGMNWGYRLSDTLHADVGSSIETVTTQIGGLSGRTEVPVAALFASGLTSSLKGSLSYDSRDDRMFPTKGWHLSGGVEWATPYLGSTNAFTRYSLRARRYFPLPLEGVLKFNLVGGLIQAPTGGVVPLFERFFMGGIYNVRGFARNTLGPTISIPTSGDPLAGLSAFNIGGTRQLYLNNEIEVPIVKAPMNLRGLVFFDIGNAFGEDEKIALSTLRSSFGWGVRWFSPVGPLRFEWGVPLVKKAGEESLVFEFTIGNAF